MAPVAASLGCKDTHTFHNEKGHCSPTDPLAWRAGHTKSSDADATACYLTGSCTAARYVAQKQPYSSSPYTSLARLLCGCILLQAPLDLLCARILTQHSLLQSGRHL